MKRVIVILFSTALATITGLYFRPSYVLIGQMDWINVLTKGYFVGSFSKFFSQNFLDESFYFVMRFTAGGFIAGAVLSFFALSKSKTGSGKKKKT